MKFDFFHSLGLALIADYYYVSFLTESGRGQDLYLLTSKKIFEQVKNIFVGLDCDFSAFEFKDDKNFVWIQFSSENEKSKVENYFEQFNFINRRNDLIAMPEMFEGERIAKQILCNWYLSAIEDFVGSDMAGTIAIPQGISEDDASERMFMVYDDKGMKGLYKGSQVFQNSKIKYTNFEG